MSIEWISEPPESSSPLPWPGAARVIPCGFHLARTSRVSELYRLAPPRWQRSEIREALDAAHGIDNPADDDPIVVIAPQQP